MSYILWAARSFSFVRPPRALFALTAAAFTAGLTVSTQAATEESEAAAIEEIVVVGTQIKGASIADALAVSVFDADDIEVFGVDSGDELMQLIPENGQNFFSEAENISGGVNSARGDIGAFNLRNLGTGNTLVLLNGRRLVNAASYQTEEVGGSFVPVNTVNSNAISPSGLDRVEVLRDGASAIYGADAVAGVINQVLDTNFEGFSARFKWTEFEHLPRDDQTLTLKWGTAFNAGRSNVGAFFNYYQRDRVNSQDDPRWADADFRYRIPEDSPWAGSTRFRNTSANSRYGQFDVVSRLGSSHSLRRNDIVDSAGEFETYPAGDARCQYDIGPGICGGEDGQGTYRHNLNENRDLASEMERYNLLVYINHEFDNGLRSFTEFIAYESKSNLNRHASASFSSSKLRVAADNYYNPFGPCGSPNRLPESVIGADVPCEGLALTIDNYRYAERPRVVDNNGDAYRVLQGLSGAVGEWDWETAFSWSQATKDDVTHNRVSNTLMQEALNDPTASAYNPFSGGVDSNIERALVDVTRESETELITYDLKLSNNALFSLPSGSVAVLAGFEYRNESFKDDRDPRLDGTIQFTDFEGDTYPYVSDVVNSSPTPDNSGDRDVISIFGELQIPILDNLDAQLALRYEDLSDVGDTTVGKVALGWRPFAPLLVRGSWSEAFRAPNLVTINEEIVARSNAGITDFACLYAAENGGDPDQDTLDCVNTTQRIAEGSQDLRPEKSDNISVGIVFEPNDDLTLTLDYWRIEKTDTIGLFGTENHTLLDLLYRLENGLANCDSAAFNPAVNRQAVGEDEAAIYTAAGICPAGDIRFAEDRYANLDKRTVAGFDVGAYYQVETGIGRFSIKYNASFLDKYEQEAGGNAALLFEAQNAGTLPAHYPVEGFSDLIRKDGNQDEKHSVRVSWRKGNFGASVSGYRLGSFYQSNLTLPDETRYRIPSYTSYDAAFDYRMRIAGTSSRLRLGVKNLTDKRAPLADRYFGYFADAHRDYGRYFYLDVRTEFE